MQEPLIAALRRATSPSHQRIEALLQLDAPFGMDHYRKVLIGFHQFLSRWEPATREALPPRLHDWFSQRQRSGLLQRDMAALPVPAQAATQLLDLPLPSPAAAFGSMYVLEGSALGGLVIARQLAVRHGIGPDNGGAYFAGRGAQTAALWRDFGQRLETEAGQAPADRDAACAAAVQTFDALLATFRPLIHEPAAA